jgi:hypothetical protein
MQQNMTVLVTFPYIQSRPTHTGGQHMENTWRYKSWPVHDHFAIVRFKMQGQVVELKKKLPNAVSE